MRTYNFFFKPVMLLLVLLLVGFIAKAADGYYYELKIYHCKTPEQQSRTEQYLRDAYLPALHHAGIKHVGVFLPVEKDTAQTLIYVLVPYSSWDQIAVTDKKVANDASYLEKGKAYINAPYNELNYTRMETVLLHAFEKMPQPALPLLSAPKAERVYELRSYESPTEQYHISKVQMFNAGGEVSLFKRLNFNAVFYADVLAGSHMPNLMYMTTFNNKADRDAHWKTFGSDPEWKALSAKPEYQHNVSKAEITFLHPTDYSDF